MYINPDSRGQCVLGEVKLLSSQSITFNIHSSAWGPSSGLEKVCLAFPKTGCLLGVNQRDTRRSERPWTHTSVLSTRFSSICVYVFICTSVQTVFSTLCFFCYGLQYLSCENLKPFLTDRPTSSQRHLATRSSNPETPSAFSVKQRLRVVSALDRTGCQWRLM